MGFLMLLKVSKTITTRLCWTHIASGPLSQVEICPKTEVGPGQIDHIIPYLFFQVCCKFEELSLAFENYIFLALVYSLYKF